MSTPVAQPVQATAAAPKLDEQPIPSIYTEQLAYERAIADAAEQLARGRRFRWERELLAVVGIVLLIDTILKLISLLYPDIGDRFIPSAWLRWAWLIWTPWSAWYFARVLSLHRRIVSKRLCFCCGCSLLDTAVDVKNRGFCPDCGTPFNLGEYIPPAGCVAALKQARQRTLEMYPTLRASGSTPPVAEPFYLYRNRGHFDRVIRRASTRIIDRQAHMLTISLRTLIVILVVLGVGGVMLFGPIAALMIPVMLPVAIVAVVAEAARLATMKARVCGARLCLRCGYPLEHCQTNDAGGGTCPECGRPFHLKEYIRPPLQWHDPNWPQLRALVMLGDPGNDF